MQQAKQGLKRGRRIIMASILDRFNVNEEIDLQEKKYLTFLIDKQFYAYPITDVIEIIAVQDITPIPEFPLYVKGIINLRGRIIPIIDVRLRFHKEEAEYTERTCIIVVNISGVDIGFIVDTVDEVLDIEDENISAAPMITSDRSTKYVTGVGKINGRIILLLDAHKMLNEEEITNLAAVAEN